MIAHVPSALAELGKAVLRAFVVRRPVHPLREELAVAVAFPAAGGQGSATPAVAALVPLIYELLDAHADTADLAYVAGIIGDVRWSAHLEYLRALQRRGREALAYLTAQDVP